MSFFNLEMCKGAFTEVVRREFPEQLMLNGAIPIDRNSIRVGQTHYEFAVMDSVGQAAIYQKKSKSIPSVDALMSVRQGVVRHIVTKFDVNDFDRDTELFSGQQYTTELMMAAREVLAQQLDAIGYLGDASYGLLGLLNIPGAANYIVPNGASASPLWSSKTPAEIFRDLTGIVNLVQNNTNGIRSIDSIGLPLAQYLSISSMPYTVGANGATETVLSYFLRTQAVMPSGVRRVIPMPMLKGQGMGGTDLAVGYKNDPGTLKFHVITEFGYKQPLPTDFGYSVNCYASTGGVQVTRPNNIVYAAGI